METKKIKMQAIHAFTVFLFLFAFSCQEEEYDFEKESPECGITEISLENQLSDPVITTPPKLDPGESKVEITVNKLIDYDNIRFRKLKISDRAKVYYYNEELNPDAINEFNFTAEVLYTDNTGTVVRGFQIKIVAENGNERTWQFYLKSNPPIDLDYVNGNGSKYSFYGVQKTIGRILVTGRDNSGNGMWTFGYKDKLNRYMAVTKKNPDATILGANGQNDKPEFNMRDDYIKFNADGTYEYSYGPDGLSMAQNTTDPYQGYFIEEGVGEWSIAGSDLMPDRYKIILSNYDTGGSVILDKCFYASWEALIFIVPAGGIDKLQFNFNNWWQ